MRLLSIELQGFKSFADRTRILFHEGINAIVGPNGCGKSNIVDAFLWVLGEQSARSLRADKMADVIFAGTKARKAVNFAEVALHFSNEDGRLPLPVKEVVIARRLYRSGESEYLINKKPARLKDLHELFSHTGLGKEAFAVIGQGRVEEEIAKSPLERRKVFDEIAGISRPLLKRKETLDRLKRSSVNVEKAKVRFDEVLRQLGELKQQADEALAFERNRSKIELIKKVIAVKKREKLCKKQTDLVTKLSALEQKKNERVAVESAASRQSALLKEQVESSWKTLSTHTQELERIIGQKNLVQQMLTAADEKIKKASFRQGQIVQEVNKGEKLYEELQREQGKSSSRYKDLEELVSAAKIEWEKALQELEQFEKAGSLNFSNQKSAQSYLSQCDRQATSKQLSLDSLRKTITDIGRSSEQVAKELKNLSTSVGDAGELEALREKRVVLVKAIDEDRAVLQDIERQVHNAEDGLKSARAEKNTQQTLRVTSQTKLTTLEGLRKNYIGVDGGVKKLLDQGKGYIELFADIFKKDKEFLKSDGVESVAAIFSSFLVVHTISDLDRLIELARKVKVGQYFCFCLERMGMDFDEWKSWIKSLVGLSNEDWKVIPGGVLIRGGMVMSFGADGKNPLLLDREIEQLTTEVKNQLELEEKSTLHEKKLTISHDSLIANRRAMDIQVRQNEMRLLEVNKLLYEAESKGAQIAERLRVLEKEKKRLEDAQLPNISNLKNLEKDVEGALSLLQSAKNELMKQESLSKEVEKKRLEQSAQVKSIETRYRTVDKEHRECERKIIEEASRITRLTEERARLSQELKAITESMAGSEGKRESLVQELQEKNELLADFQGRVTHLQLDAESKKSQQKEQEALLQKVRLEGELFRNEHLNASKELVAVETELQRIEEPLDISQELKDQFIEKSESKLQNELIQLEESSPENSQINFRAITDYEVLKNQQDFAVEELRDLETSHTALLELLAQVESDADQLFKKKFLQVREAFQINFSKLFGGGDADLILTESDDDDIFARGVEIIAKPPGKDMRTLQLLSGGEKTMTAFALLMAFFQVRPSPCCILDEVDAPLDEANVGRFTELLRSFSSICQFLLITHNKKTMATTDNLVGVSMEQKGVSTVLQLQLVS